MNALAVLRRLMTSKEHARLLSRVEDLNEKIEELVLVASVQEVMLQSLLRSTAASIDLIDRIEQNFDEIKVQTPLNAERIERVAAPYFQALQESIDAAPPHPRWTDDMFENKAPA